MTKENTKKLTVTILSLSLLTVMAGAAVAPALNTIQAHFASEPRTLIQLIISTPALFIALTGLIFPKLAARIKARPLLLMALALYVAGGCLAGAMNNIYLVLIFRALVGIGVGIIMPMSTGLLAFYYPGEMQDKLMGYSSAMNQLGGVIATLISGLLANISWRASFLVYLIGLLSIVLILLFLPDDKITGAKQPREATGRKSSFGEYKGFVITMFLLMLTFFIYPSSFAIETAAEGIIDSSYVPIIMAGMDLVAFFGGLSFVHIRKRLGINTRFLAPALFTIGYVLLLFPGGWPGAISGSVLIGFANGIGIPMIIATASKRAGKDAATTVMPLISIALYSAQFLTPFILGAAEGISGNSHMTYPAAIVCGILFAISSFTIKDKSKDAPEQK